MKTLVLGIGAFGFVVLKHLCENNPDVKFYGYEYDEFTAGYLRTLKKHPFFYEGVKLPKNSVIIKDLNKELKDTDLLIITIPCQFVIGFLDERKKYLKPGLTILNMAKGINNKTLHTIGEDLKETLKGISYNYACLSGGMIAKDLLKGDLVGGTLGIENEALGEKIRSIFESQTFKIQNYVGNTKTIELAGALKNVFVLFTGYQEGKGIGPSSIGCFFCDYYSEYRKLFDFLGGKTDDVNFYKYAIGGDLIASSFGDSRNRLFGKLIGEGKSTQEALEMMKKEKKTVEGYETLKGLYKLIEDKDDFPITKAFGAKILFS